VLGLRLNVWTSIVVGVTALIFFVVLGRRHPERDTTVRTDRHEVDDHVEAVDPAP